MNTSQSTSLTRIWESPIGPLGLTARDGMLRGIDLAPDPATFPPRPESGETMIGNPRRLDAVQTQLEAYFAGKRRSFDLELDWDQGTEFQRRVWHELGRIPYGTTRSYGEIASRLGQPGAMRAVGGANNANPLPIVIPCHRVVQSDGSLGGFAGGPAMKRRLLAVEGITPASLF